MLLTSPVRNVEGLPCPDLLQVHYDIMIVDGHIGTIIHIDVGRFRSWAVAGEPEGSVCTGQLVMNG